MFEGTKVCSKCKRELDVTDFDIRIDKGIHRLASWCRSCKAVYGKQNATSNPVASWERQLRYDFGMDSVDYEMMLKSQNGVCAICSGVNSNGDRLAVDHCHKSGKIRGILCRNCNTAIGLLCDDLSRCRAATAYLERTG